MTLRSRETRKRTGREVSTAEYGLFFVKLDRVGDRDEYVAAFGSIRNVKLYKEQYNLNGVFKEYKSMVWLAKRLETLHTVYGSNIKMLDLG